MSRQAAILASAKALQKAAASNPISPFAGAVYGGQGGYGMNQAALPRPAEEFLTGAFGPLTPIQPMSIDAPESGEERPEPRRWQYPVGWNMPVGEPGREGLKLADFNSLRTLGDLYSVARTCIQLRKNEIRSLAWDIIPTPEAAKAMRGKPSEHRDFGERRAKAVKWWKVPDAQYGTFRSWLDALLEDVFVIDALSLYLQPTRMTGKGLFGSSLGQLALIDGSTIRPLVDLHGARPLPPNVAWQQYAYGVPRVDLMSVATGADGDELGDLKGEYRGDQLLYLPYTPRTWTPYGTAPIERAIVPVMAGLHRQQYQLNWFDEGSVPNVFISPGDPNMTPTQIQNLQNALNAIAGDPAWKHKIIVLPGGSRVDPMKPTELANQFDEVIMTQVTMAFDVMPMELGISPKVSATQSSGAANQMAKASQDIHQRKSLKPMLMWLKESIFDRVLQDIWGQTDMQWTWEGLEEGEDEEVKTTVLSAQIATGIISIDEARGELQLPPWGLPETSDPIIVTTSGAVPLGAINPATGAPEPGQEQPAAGVPQSAPNAQQSNGQEKPTGQQTGGTTQEPTPGHAGGEAGADTAADDAKPAKAPAKPRTSKTMAPADQVRALLEESYPARVLGWVADAEWRYDDEVPLDSINMARRPGGRDCKKVEGIAQAIRDGKTMDPVVLVETPGRDKLTVADGYHRTLAYQHEDRATIHAWVGTVTMDEGPWDRAMHDAKLNKHRAALAELDALGRHLRKGRLISTWEARHLPARTLATIAENRARGMTVGQAVDVARSTLPPGEPNGDQEGDLPGPVTLWPGWGVDEDLAREYAARIRRALADVITTAAARRLAAVWLRFARRGGTAQAFIRMTEPDLSARFAAALRAVLVDLWRTAWNVGKSAAYELLPHHTPAPPGPGHDDGFEQWLHDQMPTINAMTDTRIRDLADHLEQAADDNESPDELGDDLGTYPQDDNPAADTIAWTEVLRAMMAGALAAYAAAGVTSVEWLAVPGAFRICLDNEAASPIWLGDTWPNGAPPVHPRCRCAVVPARP
ncbi:hypothetical protein GCM10023196_037050 [Actinoallomurus vinaceus]|uniref:ParB/Sulfiredoxin domain-containing protein n=1 Tax=Actinoallomurus vinaceus TaxID=1080074 RepID=A0ABP8UAV1_9ACTN